MSSTSSQRHALPRRCRTDRRSVVSSRLRSGTRRAYAYGCMQVPNDLPGQGYGRGYEVKMSSGECAGPTNSTGEASPGLEGARMGGVVGAAECSDRTRDAMSRIDRIPLHQRKIGSQGRQQSRDHLWALHDCFRCAAETAQNGEQIVVRLCTCRGRVGSTAHGTAAAGNEQMYGKPAVDRQWSSGSFIGHPRPHTVAEESKRYGHQRLERISQLFHQRAHGGERRLVKARSAARQLDGAEIDLGRHEAPQRSVKRGISRSMRKGKKATANDRALIPKWDPPIERHCVRRTQRAVCHERCRTKRLSARLAAPQRH